MPIRARPCNDPHCRNLRPCPVHDVGGVRAQARRVDQRPSAAARGYGSRWREYRERYFASPRVCACGCGAEVNAGNGAIDHIVPVSGPSDPLFWDTSNHQPLLRGHHSRKTAMQDGGFGHRRGGGVKSL